MSRAHSRDDEGQRDGSKVGSKNTDIDRREFVKSAGVIVAATGLNACGDNGPTDAATGSARITITGLDASALTGGAVTVTNLTDSSVTPRTVDVPPSGTAEVSDIPVGSYRVDYEPPTNHRVAAGDDDSKTVEVRENQTTDVAFTVEFISGTLRITVTGLDASATSGGSATATRTDVTGVPDVEIDIPASGTVDTTLPAGDFDVAYSPPPGHQLETGEMGTKSVTVGEDQVAEVTFTVALATGAGSVTGTVTAVADGAAVGGGFILVTANGTVQDTVAIGVDGTYSVTSLPPGDYDVAVHPNHAFSIAAGEPDPKPVTILAGQAAQVDFLVQPAILYDDFQSYADVDDLVNNSGYAFEHPEQIEIDTSPPTGMTGQAMRYIFPARPNQCTNYKVQARKHYGPGSGIDITDFWVRFVDYLDSGWLTGDDACVATAGTREYKHFHVNWAGGTQSRLRTLYQRLFDNSHAFAVQINPGGGCPIVSASPKPVVADFRGQWNTWMYHVTGLGTATTVFDFFLNGQFVTRVATDTSCVNSELDFLEFGANINHGPPLEQSRWWREVGLYSTRPSLSNGVV